MESMDPSLAARPHSSDSPDVWNVFLADLLNDDPYSTSDTVLPEGGNLAAFQQEIDLMMHTVHTVPESGPYMSSTPFSGTDTRSHSNALSHANSPFSQPISEAEAVGHLKSITRLTSTTTKKPGRTAPMKTQRASAPSTKSKRKAEIGSLEMEVLQLVKKMESLQAENVQLKHRERFLTSFTDAQSKVSRSLLSSEQSMAGRQHDKAGLGAFERARRSGLMACGDSLPFLPSFLQSVDKVVRALDTALEVAESAMPESVKGSLVDRWMNVVSPGDDLGLMHTDDGLTQLLEAYRLEGPRATVTVRRLLQASSTSTDEKLGDQLLVVREVMKALHSMTLEASTVMVNSEGTGVDDSTFNHLMDVIENMIMERVFTLAAKHPILFFSIFSYNNETQQIMDPPPDFWEGVARQLDLTETQILDILAAEEYLRHTCAQLHAQQQSRLREIVQLSHITFRSSYSDLGSCYDNEPVTLSPLSDIATPGFSETTAYTTSTSIPHDQPHRSDGPFPAAACPENPQYDVAPTPVTSTTNMHAIPAGRLPSSQHHLDHRAQLSERLDFRSSSGEAVSEEDVVFMQSRATVGTCSGNDSTADVGRVSAAGMTRAGPHASASSPSELQTANSDLRVSTSEVNVAKVPSSMPTCCAEEARRPYRKALLYRNTDVIEDLDRLIRAESNSALAAWHFCKRAFTSKQCMEIGIRSYPYLPDPLSLMAAVSRLHSKNGVRKATGTS